MTDDTPAREFAKRLMDRIESESRHAPRGVVADWIAEEYERFHGTASAQSPTSQPTTWELLQRTLRAWPTNPTITKAQRIKPCA